MKNFVLISCIFIGLIVNGQSIVFNNIYDSGDSLQNGADFIMELNNSNEYLMQMQYFNTLTSSNKNGLKSFIVDLYGNIKKELDLNINNTIIIGTGALQDNNENLYELSIFQDINEDYRYDTYLLKRDANFDTIYSKVIDIGYNNGGSNLKKVNSNEFIFLAYYYPDSTILENSQVVLVTIDTLGNVLDQWEYGGPSYDFAYDYKQTADGGFIISGKTKANINADVDLFLRKVDSTGNTEWYQEYGTSNEEDIRTWNSVETTADGGYLLAGEEYINQGIIKVVSVLKKVNNTGIKLWEKKHISIITSLILNQ